MKNGGDMLHDINEAGACYEVTELGNALERELCRWFEPLPERQRAAMVRAIDRQLDDYVANPNPRWGTVFNTSIEGSRTSPITGIRGDWTGTPFEPLYEACNQDENLAGQIFGILYKMRVIAHRDRWIGIRNTEIRPTFPTSGIALPGKTYFLANRPRR